MIHRGHVSMQRIAEELGVSRATVSNALRGRGRVSEGLAARIRARAEDLGFVPSAAGRALRDGRSLTVGLVVPDFAMPLFPTFVQAIESAARARGLALMVAEAASDPVRQQEAVADLIARGVDALCVIPMRGSVLAPQRLPVPVAVIDSAGNPLNIAASDHREGGRLVARHLARLGHRRVLVLVSDRLSTVSDERRAGLVEALSAAGAAVEVVATPPGLDGGQAVAAAFDPTRFTACAAVYDALAVGVIMGLTARGIRVPQQVSVTGFDDVVWGRIVTPALTSVAQDLDAIAAQALAYASGEVLAPRLFPVTLVERASTAPPPRSQQEILQ